jgi:citrate synthase
VDPRDVSEVLAYVAAGLVGLWGVAHAVPTRQVLAGFESITVDNRRVLLQEWLAEAFTVRGLAAAVVAATIASGQGPFLTIKVHWIC